MRSKDRILQCFALADKIDSKRIIFHPGHYPNKGDDSARKNAIVKIAEGLNELKCERPKGVYIYPETAGKRSQIGSVDDIMELCELVDYARPCIDVAHIHGFEGGSLTSSESIIRILDRVEKRLGLDYLSLLHFHMYPIEVDRNGEKKHKAFHDRIENSQMTIFESEDSAATDRYYPLAEDFIVAIKSKNINPVVVCEARDSQERGAVLMRSIFYGDN
jgi:deoxyribonuclease-4